jgi:hypothetical protein
VGKARNRVDTLTTQCLQAEREFQEVDKGLTRIDKKTRRSPCGCCL